LDDDDDSDNDDVDIHRAWEIVTESVERQQHRV
jgi:hypothetical protein